MDQEAQPSPTSLAPERPAGAESVALLVLAAIGLWLVLVWPLVTGQETLFFRDVFHTHHPLKAFGAAELHHGRIPATNPAWGLGQPFRGNPNSLAFYPGNVLYLLLPFWSAFNLHYALHWLLAGVAMVILARSLGQHRPAALLAGVTYAGSGWTLATLTFYNIVVVAAWWPLVLAAGARGGRRGTAAGALACGLALLGGEPVTALLGVPVLAAVSMSRLGVARGLLTTLGIGAGGLVVALPQIVATLRILPTTVRGGEGLLSSQASFYSLEPERLLELFLPFPFGVPGTFGPTSVDAVGVLSHLPFFFSLHFGILAIVLAGIAARRRPTLAVFAVAGIVLAWLGGLSGELLLSISAGLFRTPEKLLFWSALTLPLLAGWGMEHLLAEERSAQPSGGGGTGARRRVVLLLWVAGAGLLPLAVLFAASKPRAGDLVAASLGGLRRLAGDGTLPALETVRAWGDVQARSLLVAVALLGLAGLLVRARRPGLVVGLQLLSVLQLQPLVLTDDVSHYAEPPLWGEAVAAGTAVIHVRGTYPPWRVEGPPPTYPSGSYALDSRAEARELGAAPGVLHGLSYPAAPDLDGMVHRFQLLTLFRLSQGSWSERVAWFRVLGVDLLVAPEPVASPALDPVGTETHAGSEVHVYRARDPAPRVWWPRSTRAAATPGEAFSLVAEAADPRQLAVVPLPMAQDPDGAVQAVVWEPDHIELEVETLGGGLIVVRRAFSNLWRARDTGGEELPVLPADLALLGIVVPPGARGVVLEIDSRPEGVAGVLAALGFVALGAAAFARRRPRT